MAHGGFIGVHQSVEEGLVFLVRDGLFSVCCSGRSLFFVVMTHETLLTSVVGPLFCLDVYAE